MGNGKSPGVDDMIYNYIIVNNKVIELEGPEKIRFDRPGTNIDIIIQNKNRSESFTDSFKRKLQWLKENHPELLL
jgi:hypothetical protein